jgi:hypothetical protein
MTRAKALLKFILFMTSTTPKGFSAFVDNIPAVRNSPSFQRSIDQGHFSIDLHAWRRAESGTFAMFVYEKVGERLLRHFTGSDENEVIRQAVMWCEKNS